MLFGVVASASLIRSKVFDRNLIVSGLNRPGNALSSGLPNHKLQERKDGDDHCSKQVNPGTTLLKFFMVNHGLFPTLEPVQSQRYRSITREGQRRIRGSGHLHGVNKALLLKPGRQSVRRLCRNRQLDWVAPVERNDRNIVLLTKLMRFVGDIRC